MTTTKTTTSTTTNSAPVNRDENPDNLRETIRTALEQEGPLYIPPHLKDPNFIYRWETYSSRQPYRFDQCLDLGYQFVNPDELGSGARDISDRHIGFTSSADGNRIEIKLNDKDVAYLMKIDRQRFNLIQDVKMDEVRSSERRLEDKASRESYYGSIKIGNKTDKK